MRTALFRSLTHKLRDQSIDCPKRWCQDPIRPQLATGHPRQKCDADSWKTGTYMIQHFLVCDAPLLNSFMKRQDKLALTS